MNGCAILTYHSQNIDGHGTADNDHVALASDLERLHAAGVRVVPLGWVVDWLDGARPAADLEGAVALTFDDGSVFDVRDVDYPGLGPQRGFLGILEDFAERRGPDARPALHATSFVIASPEARQVIDEHSLGGRGWMEDGWWREVQAGGRIALGNHSWDHVHPALAGAGEVVPGFAHVDDDAACRAQVLRSAEYIAGCAGAWPEFFAYPCGQSSAYLREEWFPAHRETHRCRAAFGTRPAHVTPDSDRWNLPRFVCRRDWKTPEQLLALLG
jgi:hypothetical protein